MLSQIFFVPDVAVPLCQIDPVGQYRSLSEKQTNKQTQSHLIIVTTKK